MSLSSRIIAVGGLAALLGLLSASLTDSVIEREAYKTHVRLGEWLVQEMGNRATDSERSGFTLHVQEAYPTANLLWVSEGGVDEFGISRGQRISFRHGKPTDAPVETTLAEDVNTAIEKGFQTRLLEAGVIRFAGRAALGGSIPVCELPNPMPRRGPESFIWMGLALFTGVLLTRIRPVLPSLILATAPMVGMHYWTLNALQTPPPFLPTSDLPRTFGAIFWIAGLTVGAGVLLQMVSRKFEALVEDLKAQPTVYAYVLPAVVATAVLVFLPFLAGIGLAFFEAGPGDPAAYHFVGLENFTTLLEWHASSMDAHTFRFVSEGKTVFTAPKFYFTLGVTVLWTVLNVALHLSIGLGLALLLNRKDLRFRGLYRVLLIVPWAVPSYITALTWKLMFHTQYGSVNKLLVALGMERVDWLGSSDTVSAFVSNFGANLITNTWLGFPFMMVVSLGALQSIPGELYEAARIDGATQWQKFRHITLPLLKPALLPSVLLGSIWTFNMFNVVYLVSGGAPFGKTNILITEAFRFFHVDKNYGMAAAYSIVIFLILLGYASVTNRITKATEGALK